jgi:hypothetical protein
MLQYIRAFVPGGTFFPGQLAETPPKTLNRKHRQSSGSFQGGPLLFAGDGE